MKQALVIPLVVLAITCFPYIASAEDGPWLVPPVNEQEEPPIVIEQKKKVASTNRFELPPGIYQLKKPSFLESSTEPIKIAADKEGKSPFSVRHPKIYLKWRKFRKLCQVTSPLIQTAGSIAQVFVPFLL